MTSWATRPSAGIGLSPRPAVGRSGGSLNMTSFSKGLKRLGAGHRKGRRAARASRLLPGCGLRCQPRTVEITPRILRALEQLGVRRGEQHGHGRGSRAAFAPPAVAVEICHRDPGRDGPHDGGRRPCQSRRSGPRGDREELSADDSNVGVLCTNVTARGFSRRLMHSPQAFAGEQPGHEQHPEVVADDRLDQAERGGEVAHAPVTVGLRGGCHGPGGRGSRAEPPQTGISVQRRWHRRPSTRSED